LLLDFSIAEDNVEEYNLYRNKNPGCFYVEYYWGRPSASTVLDDGQDQEFGMLDIDRSTTMKHISSGT